MASIDNYLDLSDLIETFDLDENRRLLREQLEAIQTGDPDLVDNFQLIYQRYSTVKTHPERTSVETKDDVEDLYLNICRMYVDMIGDSFNAQIDEEFLEDHEKSMAATALAYYLFFVLHLRSNLFNVLLSFISSHKSTIAANFESLRQRHDAVTETNRSIEDPDVALITSCIYDVIDWVMEEMTADDFFLHMEDGYVAKDPIRKLYEDGHIDGGFVVAMRDLLKENISLKARIGFDIICRLRGFDI